MKRFGRWFGIVFIAALSLMGLYNATNELPQEVTRLQLSVGFGQLAYGFFGVFATVGFIRRRPWVVTMSAAWGLAATYTASVASFAFHDPKLEQQGTLMGVISSGVSCLIMTAIFVQFARVTVRSPKSAPQPTQ